MFLAPMGLGLPLAGTALPWRLGRAVLASGWVERSRSPTLPPHEDSAGRGGRREERGEKPERNHPSELHPVP